MVAAAPVAGLGIAVGGLQPGTVAARRHRHPHRARDVVFGPGALIAPDPSRSDYSTPSN